LILSNPSIQTFNQNYTNAILESEIMKTVKLNLKDKLSGQKFQHILTSFASDYIDLVAPEQTLFKLDQQTLIISFVLIDTSIINDRTRANIFTQNLEAFLTRLPLVETRRVELELVNLHNDETLFTTGFNLNYIAAIASNSSSKSTLQKLTSAPVNLVRNFKFWLTQPQVQQNINHTTQLAVRSPKTFLAATGNFAKQNLIVAIDWVDTFPWEDWAKKGVAQQKRRHDRNLFKALVEDFLVIALLIFMSITVVDMLSIPPVNLANVPSHYDQALDTPVSRCDWAGVTKKNYVCLARGMSYRQVVSILGVEGKPLGFDDKFGDKSVIVAWQQGNGAMNITFRGDYLVAKAYRDLSS
jgi:hypothetical protein